MALMRRFSLGITAVLLLAVTAGCGGDELANRAGAPVTSPTAAPPPEREAEGYVWGGIKGLEKVLRTRVVRSAGVDKPVTSQCDTTEVRPRFTCTVHYDGETVTYTVTTSGSGWMNWEATPDSLVMTREGVLASVWRQHSAHTTELRCEEGIPEKARVKPGTELEQRCYFRPTKDHPAYGEGATIERYPNTMAVRLVIEDGDIIAAPILDE